MAETQLVPVISKKVDIDGEQFCLEIVPASSAKLVQTEKDALTGNLNLPALVDDLHKLGCFCRVAYYGVVGHTDLQIKVQNVGYTVTKVCQESDVTVVLFGNTCTEVIETLQSSYEFLCDGLEDIAIENFKMLSDIANKMAGASEKLKQKFEAAEKEVQETLNVTIEEKGKEEEHKKSLIKDQEDAQMQRESADARREAAEAMERDKARQYQTTMAKEQEVERKLDATLKEQTSMGHQFKNMFKTIIGIDSEGADAKLLDVDKQRVSEARKERMQAMREMEQQREAQLKATLEMRECLLKMQQSKCEEGVSDSAISALHGALGALKAMTTIMMDASKFWTLMHEHCKAMTNEKMMKTIETAMKKPEAVRLKVWGSNGFIKDGVRYYAKWVALRDVCDIYKAQIRGAETEMKLYLRENPTQEEARGKLPELLSNLDRDLNEAIVNSDKKAIKFKADLKAIEDEANVEDKENKE